MCLGCGTEKEESDFHKESSRIDGLATQCKACRSAHYKKTYQSKKDKLRAGIVARRKELAARVEALKRQPCMDCGGTFAPYVMDFDHRDGNDKVKGISTFISRGSWTRIEAEIAKCDLVCANCHRIRTFTRLRGLDAVPKRPTELPAKQLLAGSSPASVSRDPGSIPGGPSSQRRALLRTTIPVTALIIANAPTTGHTSQCMPAALSRSSRTNPAAAPSISAMQQPPFLAR